MSLSLDHNNQSRLHNDHHGSDPSGDDNAKSDNARLTEHSENPFLHQRFGFKSLLAFSCILLMLWGSILDTCNVTYSSSGSAGVVWGFLVVFIGTLSTFPAIGELVSIAPVAGGQFTCFITVYDYQVFFFVPKIIGWLCWLQNRAENHCHKSQVAYQPLHVLELSLTILRMGDCSRMAISRSTHHVSSCDTHKQNRRGNAR